MSDNITPAVPRGNRPLAGDGLSLTPNLPKRAIELGTPAAGPKVIEFVVRAHDDTTNKPMAPFLVEAATAAQARGLALRKWLTLLSVEPYVPTSGEEKPRLLKYGPPISSRQHLEDYREWGSSPKSDGRGRIPYTWLFLAFWVLVGILRAMMRPPGQP